MRLNQRVLDSSPFFIWGEFYKPHHKPTQMQLDNTIKLVKMLIPFREKFKHPFNVDTRLATGFRTWEEHVRAYGRANPPASSRHLFGDAVDFAFNINKFTKDEIALLRRTWPGGMGVYNWGIHLDAWNRRRW